MKAMEYMLQDLQEFQKMLLGKANEILRSLERKNIITGKKQEKQDKKQVERTV